MPVIGLLGPHAIGKTTAALRWMGRYGADKLETYSLDDLRKQYPDNESKRELIRDKLTSRLVTVVETGRADRIFDIPGVYTLVLVSNYSNYRLWLVDRCRKKGKVFREDYWTDRRCKYEGEDRFVNFANRYLNPTCFTLCKILDRSSDWAEIDKVFGSIFRRMNNDLRRNRCR